MYLIYVNLHLKTSKTDTFHHGCDILLTATGQVACQVASLMQYLKLSRPRPSDYPLFHLLDGSPPTRSHYVKLLQDSVQSAGYSGAEFNGHSRRKGFATSASAGKIPDHVISAMGRWLLQNIHQSTVLRYLQRPAGGSGPWNRGG
jgi:hypothetical protein